MTGRTPSPKPPANLLAKGFALILLGSIAAATLAVAIRIVGWALGIKW